MFSAFKSPQKQFSQGFSVLVWSSFLAVMAGLMVRFFYISFSSALLKFFSIGFNYHIFRISYENAAGGNWSAARVFVVYILGALVFFFLGLLVFYLNEKARVKNLKLRLFFTWLAFFAVFLFPLQALAGVFVYDEMGLGLRWFIHDWVFRLVVALLLFGAGLLFRVAWIRLFLKTAWAIELIDSYGKRKKHIKLIFLQSLLVATVVLVLFSAAAGSLTWLMVNIGLVLTGLLFAAFDLPEKTPRIVKSEDTLNLSHRGLVKMGVVIAVLLGLGFL